MRETSCLRLLPTIILLSLLLILSAPALADTVLMTEDFEAGSENWQIIAGEWQAIDGEYCIIDCPS